MYVIVWIHVLCVITLCRNGGYPALWLCRRSLLAQAVSEETGQVMWDHIRHVRWVLASCIEDVPHSCLRIEDNRVIFLLLSLKGDPEWRY